jgi:hypothetical protein
LVGFKVKLQTNFNRKENIMNWQILRSTIFSLTLLVAVGCQSITPPNPVDTSPSLKISSSQTTILLDKDFQIDVQVTSTHAGLVKVTLLGNDYIDLEQTALDFQFAAPGTQKVSLRAQITHNTPISVFAKAKGSDWQDSRELQFAPNPSLIARQNNREFSSDVQFLRSSEKARLARDRTQPLETVIKSSAQGNPGRQVMYQFKGGTTPIDPAQLDEPAPQNGKGKSKQTRGAFCGVGALQTVRFVTQNFDFPKAPSESFQGAHPLKGAKITVYDNNGNWNQQVAAGYTNDNGEFTFNTPYCDTSGFFDWSQWDAVYKLEAASPNSNVLYDPFQEVPTYWSPTYWDQQTVYRQILFNSNNGLATRSLWTLNLMSYANNFVGDNAPRVRVRHFPVLGPTTTFSPVGQIMLGTANWDSIYPIWHEFGHNTFYNATFSLPTYNNCIDPVFPPCIPDFAPLLRANCAQIPVNNLIDVIGAIFSTCFGFDHEQKINQTEFFAANEGWAQVTHQIFGYYFMAQFGSFTDFLGDGDPNSPGSTSGQYASGYPFYARWCGKAVSCRFPTHPHLSEENYVATMFFRVITEAIANWQPQVIPNPSVANSYLKQDIIPTLAQAESARNVWRRVRSFLPRYATTKVTPVQVYSAIANAYPVEITSAPGKQKVCTILKQIDLSQTEINQLIGDTVSCVI